MQRTNQKKELLHFRIALVVFDIQDGSGIGIDKIGNFILGKVQLSTSGFNGVSQCNSVVKHYDSPQTYFKLKPNHGDLKATQGDTGHAEVEMITKVYAHILDEDRKINAQKFDSAFYSNPDLRQIKAPQGQGISAEQLLAQLKESPELANALAQLLASGKAG